MALTQPAGHEDADPVLRAGTAVRRLGVCGWLHVTGELDAMTRRHVDDLLDWLINDGVTQITVSLDTAKQIDHDCLVVLRVAQAELHNRGGHLFVTATRATTRAMLRSLNQSPSPEVRDDQPIGAVSPIS